MKGTDHKYCLRKLSNKRWLRTTPDNRVSAARTVFVHGHAVLDCVWRHEKHFQMSEHLSYACVHDIYARAAWSAYSIQIYRACLNVWPCVGRMLYVSMLYVPSGCPRSSAPHSTGRRSSADGISKLRVSSNT